MSNRIGRAVRGGSMVVAMAMAMVAGGCGGRAARADSEVSKASARAEALGADPAIATSGVVTETLADARLVCVGQVRGQRLTQGTIVTFVDHDANPLTTGRVVRVVADELHVRYDPPHAKRRAPRAGDLMVRLK